jgi:hydroxymethylpyrimidine pyrophosphatase-like HAD family hydrolase
MHSRGVHVSVCTGRMYSGTRDIARSIEVKGAIGCLDGSHVVNVHDDQDLLSHPILNAAMDPLLDVLEEDSPVTFLFSEDAVLHDDMGEPFLAFVRLWTQRAVRLESVLDRATFGGARAVSAVLTLGQEDQIKRAAERIQTGIGEHLQVGLFASKRSDSSMWGMVVRAAGITKATALSHIAKHYGVTVEETVAVGDWLNDVTMLEAAGKSFAMAQAPDSVKEAATEVLDADMWQGGGIAEAAERAGLL